MHISVDLVVMGELSFSGQTLRLGRQEWQFEHPVADARITAGRLVVLYDPDARRERFGQFPNLIALDLGGRPL